jgi:hypothetical protein
MAVGEGDSIIARLNKEIYETREGRFEIEPRVEGAPQPKVRTLDLGRYFGVPI